MRPIVERDFNISPYKLNYNGMTFVFSSIAIKNKFINRIEDYKKHETLYLKDKYGNLNINFDLFLTFALYKKLEKRGFRIYTDDNIEIKEDTLFLICYKSYGKHF